MVSGCRCRLLLLLRAGGGLSQHPLQDRQPCGGICVSVPCEDVKYSRHDDMCLHALSGAPAALPAASRHLFREAAPISESEPLPAVGVDHVLTRSMQIQLELRELRRALDYSWVAEARS